MVSFPPAAKISDPLIGIYTGWHKEGRFLYGISRRKTYTLPTEEQDRIQKRVDNYSTPFDFLGLGCDYAVLKQLEAKNL